MDVVPVGIPPPWCCRVSLATYFASAQEVYRHGRDSAGGASMASHAVMELRRSPARPPLHHTGTVLSKEVSDQPRLNTE